MVKYLGLWSLIYTLLFLSALQARELSLEDALNLAQEKSWDIKIEQGNIEKTMLQRRQVIATVLPQVSASSRYSNYLTKPVISGFSLNSTHEVDYALSVRQKLFEFGGIGSSLEAAQALLKQSQFQKEQVQKYTKLEVTLAYYAVLLAQEQLSIVKSSYENAKNNLAILKRSFAGGRAPRGDILRLETDIVSRQSSVKLAESDLKSAHLGLKELLKIDKDEKLKLTTSLKTELPLIEGQNISRDSLSDNPDLKVMEQGKLYLEKAAEVEGASLLPKIGLVYNLSRSGRSDESPTGFEENVNSQVIGLELTWSLWNGGGNRARVQEAKKDALVADYRYKKQLDKVFLELNKAVSEYSTIRSNLETDRKSLALAQESFELIQNLLRVGKTSITELNSTEGVLNQIKANYAANLFKANERLSMIRYIMNERSPK